MDSKIYLVKGSQAVAAPTDPRPRLASRELYELCAIEDPAQRLMALTRWMDTWIQTGVTEAHISQEAVLATAARPADQRSLVNHIIATGAQALGKLLLEPGVLRWQALEVPELYGTKIGFAVTIIRADPKEE